MDDKNDVSAGDVDEKVIGAGDVDDEKTVDADDMGNEKAVLDTCQSGLEFNLG